MVNMTSDSNTLGRDGEHGNIKSSHNLDSPSHDVSPCLNSTDEGDGDSGKVRGARFTHESVEEVQYGAEGNKGVESAGYGSEDMRVHRREMNERFQEGAGAGEEVRDQERYGEEILKLGKSWGRPQNVQRPRHVEKEGYHDRAKGADSEARNFLMDSSDQHPEQEGQGQDQFEQLDPYPGDQTQLENDEHTTIRYHDTRDGEETIGPVQGGICDTGNRASGDFDSNNGRIYPIRRHEESGSLSTDDRPSAASSSFRHSGSILGGVGSVSECDGTEQDKGDREEDNEGEEGAQQREREHEQRQEYYQRLVGDSFQTISESFATANRAIRDVETCQKHMLEAENDIGENLVKFGMRVREATQLMQSQILAAFTDKLDSPPASAGRSEKSSDSGSRDVIDQPGESGTVGAPLASTIERHTGGQLGVGMKEGTDRDKWAFGRQGTSGIEANYRSHYERSKANGHGGPREEGMAYFGKPIDNTVPQSLDDRNERQTFGGLRTLKGKARGEPNDAENVHMSEAALKRPRWN